MEAQGARWPTWIPGAATLAYSYSGGERATVLAHDLRRPLTPPTTLYENETGVTAVLGPGTPHYLCPSPNGKWMGAVAPGSDGMALSIVNLTTTHIVARVPGAPIFSGWSFDSRLLAVHAGADLVVVDATTGRTRRVVPSDAMGFRAPAIGPNGEMAYVARNGRLLALAWGAIDGSSWAPGPVTRGGAVCVFRPGSDELWLASAPMGNTGLLSMLSFAQRPETAVHDVYKGPFAAFSWSPSGRKLVIAVPRQPGDDRTALVALGADGTVLAECETFLPSDDQRAYWSFFDQYSQSHSSWLVDGDEEYFVVSGRHGTDRVSPSFGTSAGNRILLWRAERSDPLIDLCSGEIAIPAPPSVVL